MFEILHRQQRETEFYLTEKIISDIPYTKTEDYPQKIENIYKGLAMLENLALLPAPKWEMKSSCFNKNELRRQLEFTLSGTQNYIRCLGFYEEQMKKVLSIAKKYTSAECKAKGYKLDYEMNRIKERLAENKYAVEWCLDSAYDSWNDKRLMSKAEKEKKRAAAIDSFHRTFQDGGMGYADRVYMVDQLREC